MEKTQMDNMQLWQRAAEDIHWYKAPTELLGSSNPPFYRWFPGPIQSAATATQTCWIRCPALPVFSLRKA